MSDLPEPLDLDIAVSSLVADGSDTQLMVRLLTERLADALGERLRVEREGFMRKNGKIRRVEIRFDGVELVAELAGASPTFSCGRVSGGIKIRTEKVDAPTWIRELLATLEREASSSSSTRLALEAIILGEPQ